MLAIARRSDVVSGPRPGARLALSLAATALLLTALPAAASAQEPEREEACRCVDASGNEIESCTCLRIPDPPDLPALQAWARRARLGISLEPDMDAGGARIRDVMEGSPAEEAGLRGGDVITALDGHRLSEPLESGEEELDLDGSVHVQRLLALMADVEPGDEVEVTYRRGDETRTAAVVTEENPAFGTVRGLALLREGDLPRVYFRGPDEGWEAWGERLGERLGEMGRRWEFRVPEGEGGVHLFRFDRPDDAPRAPFVIRGGEGCGGLLGAADCVDGVRLETLNPELGEYFGTEEGVLVTEVAEDSSLGLRPGDVVQAVDGREVRSVDHLRRILWSYRPEEEIRFRVIRKEEAVEVLGRRD